MDAPTNSETVLVTTPDGRRLGVCRWGPHDGAPLFLLHGTPGSRFLRRAGTAYDELGLQVITYDRPGYGVSTPVPGQRVSDAAADIVSIADQLGFDHFAVAGISGGGPRALAAAALLPDRVTRCATVVSGAPRSAPDLDFDAGMAAEDAAAWQAAADGGDALEADCTEALDWALGGLPGLTFDSDEEEAMLRAAFTEAFRQGVVGYRDDRVALACDWGFAVDEVRVPTQVMLALEDPSIPRTHWDWLRAHLPHATLVPVPGNHFGPREEPELQLMAWVGDPTGVRREGIEPPTR